MIGYQAYEGYRIARGIPTGGSELTQDHTPYDVGLWNFISYTKGCYIGQEVIARLDTYQKVRRGLAGVMFDRGAGRIDRKSMLSMGGEEVGWITSVTEEPIFGARLGLAVMRSDIIANGANVVSEGVEATVCELPVRWP
jgi:hypothetical protein